MRRTPYQLITTLQGKLFRLHLLDACWRGTNWVAQDLLMIEEASSLCLWLSNFLSGLVSSLRIILNTHQQIEEDQNEYSSIIIGIYVQQRRPVLKKSGRREKDIVFLVFFFFKLKSGQNQLAKKWVLSIDELVLLLLS